MISMTFNPYVTQAARQSGMTEAEVRRTAHALRSRMSKHVIVATTMHKNILMLCMSS